jgi:hypothetical protein
MSRPTSEVLDEVDRGALALRLYEVNLELRPDREPPISHVEWARLNWERRRLQMALGWVPNLGRR